MAAAPTIKSVTLSFLTRFLKNEVDERLPGATTPPTRLNIPDDEFKGYFEMIRDRLWDTTTHAFTTDRAIIDGPPSHIAPDVQNEFINIAALSTRFPNLGDALDVFDQELQSIPTPPDHPPTWSSAYDPFIWGFLEHFGELFTTTPEEKLMIASIKRMPISSDRIKWIASKNIV
jgi:hypothetical protein